MPLVVHHFDVSNDRDFLFESKENIILIFYVEMMNVAIKAMIARNDNDKSMQIPRNYRLDYVVEINYLNAFVIDVMNDDVRNLVVRKSKVIHQND